MTLGRAVHRPLIGITGASCEVGRAVWEGARSAYVRCVQNAGGIPVVLPAVLDPSSVVDLCDGLAGLVFAGGGDIDPGLYGEQAVEQVHGVSPERDAFERALLARACDSGVPVLAICRGMQMLNVVFGGSLFQHIADFPEHLDISDAFTGTQQVNVDSDSELFRVVGTRALSVNSLHHQAIRNVGRSLKVTAVSSDGIIEGLEIEGCRTVLGVQWHPELLEKPEQRNIFSWLVSASENRI